jgi:hypothetical protein
VDECHLRLRFELCQRHWMDWAALSFAEVSRFLPLFLSTAVARSTAVAGRQVQAVASHSSWFVRLGQRKRRGCLHTFADLLCGCFERYILTAVAGPRDQLDDPIHSFFAHVHPEGNAD